MNIFRSYRDYNTCLISWSIIVHSQNRYRYVDAIASLTSVYGTFKAENDSKERKVKNDDIPARVVNYGVLDSKKLTELLQEAKVSRA